MSYSEIPSIRIAGSGKSELPGYGLLKISGTGRVCAEEISTKGSSRIPGGLRVRNLRSSGSTLVEGDITADSITFSGSAHIEGDLNCNELSKSGSLKVERKLNADFARVSGSTKVNEEGIIKTELCSSGSISFGGDLVSEGKIRYSGVMDVEGGLKARYFEAKLGSNDSHIRKGVNANFIDVRKEESRMMGFLVTRDIVGEEIILENVLCDNIEGDKIIILPGCTVRGTNRYRDDVKVDRQSKLNCEPQKIL
jgi:cytoskeletal protein CcmA (bactofilin family)